MSQEPGQHSLASDKATGWATSCLIHSMEDVFLFSEKFRLALGLTQPLIFTGH